MNEHFALTDRQQNLLRIVSEGAGEWDARRIDLTMDYRYGPGEVTVLRELEQLRDMGLVRRIYSSSGVGGRWEVSASGEHFLRRHQP